MRRLRDDDLSEEENEEVVNEVGIMDPGASTVRNKGWICLFMFFFLMFFFFLCVCVCVCVCVGDCKL